MSAPSEVSAVVVPGIGAVVAGTDLGALVAEAVRAARLPLADHDVVVVASKVVAKAEGRTVPADRREEALDAESVAEVAARTLPDGRRTRVVRSRVGPVLAAAGIDASDVPAGTVLLLPADPDASARALRARLHEVTGVRPAVLVTDTSGRPWREGVTDFALGAAGLTVLDDARGRLDSSGRPLEVTVRGVADEVSALADLVKGKAEGTPVALVRGLGAHVTTEDGAGASVLVRGPAADWFRHGHVEAVWRALGHHGAESPAVVPAAEDLDVRLARAVRIALAPLAGAVSARVEGATVTLDGEPFPLGRAVERLVVSAWAEDLEAVPGTGAPGRGGPVVVRARAAGPEQVAYP